MLTLKQISEELQEHRDKVRAMKQVVDESGREYTEDERATIGNHLDRIEYLQSEQVQKEATRYEAALSSGDEGVRRGKAPRVDVKVTREPHEDDPKFGFRDLADLCSAVLNTGKTQKVDDRLRPLAAVGSDEHSTFADPYGGFLIPEQLMSGVLEVGNESDPTAPLVRQVPMDVSTVRFNARVDKNHSTSVSGGLTVSREPETGTGTSSRQKYEQVVLEAHDLVGVAYVTERLIDESPSSIIALINAGFDDEFPAHMLDEKINGTGADQPEGVLNSACTISVAKEGGQSADTIVGNNVLKMRSRCWGYGSAIWLANHDCYPQLATAHVAGTNSDSQIYQHSLIGDRPDMLLGRPIYYSEFPATLGDNGDIILGNWSQYLWGTRGGMKRRESMHVRFLERERTLQIYVCNDGRPWWKSALTPKSSSTTLSPFVTLAARA